MTPERVLAVMTALGCGPHDWLAGSAAVCPKLADDIDLWFTKKSQLLKQEFSSAIWKELPTLGGGYAPLGGLIEKRLETTVPGMVLNGVVQEPIKIQLMFCPTASIWDLLSRFDMSCHAWARNLQDFIVAAPGATMPGEPINVLVEAANNYLCPPGECVTCDGARMLETPPSSITAQRLADFTARYANITPEDLW